MKHDKFDQIPKDYMTFAELAEYARKRAKHSAGRCGHQEFAYWRRIFFWAKSEAESHPDDTVDDLRVHLAMAIRRVKECADGGWGGDAADWYARAVHLRQMLLNHGEKPARLSLAWLRDAAERMT